MLGPSAVAHERLGRYIPQCLTRWMQSMRAEIQAIVDDIKQSVGLLRRHL
jgi:hypothetical protein